MLVIAVNKVSSKSHMRGSCSETKPEEVVEKEALLLLRFQKLNIAKKRRESQSRRRLLSFVRK